MSEQEFENWLSLLAGLLQLSPEQRKSISNELRSHLEERMEDLIDAGSSREEAIAVALEEFGDTAALAHHFTSNAHLQRRRLMRYTYGTIAAVTCAILVLATFWPQQDGQVMQNLIAQSAPEQGAADTAAESAQAKPMNILEIDPTNPFQGNRERLEAKLAQPYQVEFFAMPIRDVLDDIKVSKQIPFYFEPGILGEAIDPDMTIDMQFSANSISIKTFLDFLLLEAGVAETHGYTIRDNIIVFTEKTNTTEVAVYNCLDLLSPAHSHSSSGGGLLGGSSAGDEDIYMSEMGESMYGAGSMGPAMPPPTSSDQHLMRVIINTIAPETWIVAGRAVSEQGGTGSIDAINGMIVIKHTREVHEEVQELLKLLREAKDQVAVKN